LTEGSAFRWNLDVSTATDRPRFQAETRTQWRRWLAAHHDSESGVWLVTWKKASGQPILSYDEAVSEALAFGWIDSVGGKMDHDRTMLYFSPRRPGSSWSRPNKLRVDQLRREGQMTAAGEAVIAVSEANGGWSRLDDVEDLVVPPDLDEAFAAYAGSRDNWDRFPPSARRGILEWIVQAKRPETRQKRINQTAESAARNVRANQWQPRS